MSKKGINYDSKDTFDNSIVVKKSKEEFVLEKLQQDFKNEYIFEEDIDTKYKEKLIALYKKQNKEMREKIELEKKEIRKLLDELKV